MARSATSDCLIVGGGVVGLSAAYELAMGGRTVRLLERGKTGREASWAGAGILPPGAWFSDHLALEQLAHLSQPRQREWSLRLREATGVDDELETSGALYTITDENEARLVAKFARWRAQGVESRRLSQKEVAEIAPGFVVDEAFFLPDEMQLRNPRRLEALRLACLRLGVDVVTEAAVERFEQDDDRLLAARTADSAYSAGEYLLTAGAWTGALAERLRIQTTVFPVRGQMLLLRCPQRRLDRIFHRDGSYLVPRRDGRVLVGATLEHAGFDKSTVGADIEALRRFAIGAAPEIQSAEVEASWAGLRPASGDGLPLIGRLPGLANGWIASGHFRSGLQFAPATAVLVRQLISGEPTEMDLAAFDPGRFASPPA